MLISLEQLIGRYGLQIHGVLHLGAHQAEEAAAYRKAGAVKVIWVEGNPELMPVLKEALREFPGQSAYNILVSDKDDEEVEFNVTNNFQSSSLFHLGTHKIHHPGVTIHHTLKLKTHRLDTYFDKNCIDVSNCDFLNIDLQGAELLALRGLGKRLEQVQYVYTEVNVGAVYVGCATLYELDKFLHQHGFLRVALKLTKWQWGDAFYMRTNPSLPQRTGNLVSALCYQTLQSITNPVRNWSKAVRRLPKKIWRSLFRVKDPGVNPSDNGETAFLADLVRKSTEKIVVFDVGANVGLYSQMVLGELAGSGKTDFELHLFEPQEKCVQELVRLFGGDARIRVNHFALSDTEGETDIYYDVSGSSSASLYERKEISLPQQEKVRLRTLASYLDETGVNSIHLLKIDTEGNEKRVLAGGGERVHPSVIKSIQFEYGGTYLDAGITLAEVVQLLMTKGYRVGKLWRGGVAFKDHIGEFVEDYRYSNYVALAKP